MMPCYLTACTLFCSLTAALSLQPAGAAPAGTNTPAAPVELGSEGAYAQLYSLVAQMPLSGAGSLVHLDTIELMHNFELAPTKDLLIAKKSGLYFVLLTAQMGTKPPGSNGYVDCWFVKNGKAYANSNSRQSVETANFAGLMNTGFILQIEAGDTLGIMLSASGPSLGLIPSRTHEEASNSSVDFLIYKIGQGKNAAKPPL